MRFILRGLLGFLHIMEKDTFSKIIINFSVGK